MTFSDFSYFSFVTLITLGYGDIMPITHAIQMLAVFEATIG
jgi:voltage-gated potassium channel Kch